MKPGRLNARPNHLSRIENGKEPTNLDEGFLDVKIFTMRVVDKHFVDIIQFMSTGVSPE